MRTGHIAMTPRMEEVRHAVPKHAMTRNTARTALTMTTMDLLTARIRDLEARRAPTAVIMSAVDMKALLHAPPIAEAGLSPATTIKFAKRMKITHRARGTAGELPHRNACKPPKQLAMQTPYVNG